MNSLPIVSRSTIGAAVTHRLDEGMHSVLADELEPETDEEILAMVDDMILHDISCEVAVASDNESPTLLEGLSSRGFIYTDVDPDYKIFQSTVPFLPTGLHVSQ